MCCYSEEVWRLAFFKRNELKRKARRRWWRSEWLKGYNGKHLVRYFGTKSRKKTRFLFNPSTNIALIVFILTRSSHFIYLLNSTYELTHYKHIFCNQVRFLILLQVHTLSIILHFFYSSTVFCASIHCHYCTNCANNYTTCDNLHNLA